MLYSFYANKVLMVEPTNFFFNTEAAADNEFMHKDNRSSSKLSKCAIKEHQNLRKKILDAGIDVVNYKQQKKDLPDSLFPNNWISTHKYPKILDETLV